MQINLPAPIEYTEDVLRIIQNKGPVAIGVSGGKDSCAVAFATTTWLDQQGHTGPRILIHSDLGIVEWEDSLPTCRRLAQALGLELVVVQRGAGGLMERWETRWKNNCRRYINLECVKLILPWSTASMRFCTSELKTSVICRDLQKRFPSTEILSVTGIRREESSSRQKAPICYPQPLLLSRKYQTSGFNWNSILGWTKEQVFAYLAEQNFRIHEAYLIYDSSRVSCSFCILGSIADLQASSKCEANQDIYRRMVTLEVVSTFSFQDNKWLADVAPHLLSEELQTKVLLAKRFAKIRTEAEAKIPPHLLYTKGWPTCVPTLAEAHLLGEVRRIVGDLLGLEMQYTDPSAIILRYEELMAQAKRKEA